MNISDQNALVWILIPAYNEDAVIQTVIREIRAAGFQNVLVVADGSTDNTPRVAEQAGAEVLSLLINRGQGAALRAGLEYIRDTKQVDIVVTFDADGQHQPEDIAKLIQPIRVNAADIVLGSRFLSEQQFAIPFVRKLILKAGILFTNCLSGVRLTDTHNGLRALNSKALHSISITHRGMEHASDIIDQIPKHSLRYTEVPVSILYTEYSLMKGQRSGNFIKIGLRIILQKFFP
jgi:polyprenyl-phospho-N-acetylgalactosaminyl synthase